MDDDLDSIVSVMWPIPDTTWFLVLAAKGDEVRVNFVDWMPKAEDFRPKRVTGPDGAEPADLFAGMPLHVAAHSRCSPSMFGLLSKVGDRSLDSVELRALVRPVLDAVRRGDLVMAGKPSQRGPDATYVRFEPGDISELEFDVLRGLARMTAGTVEHSFRSVRTFTPDEWRVVAAARGRLSPKVRRSAVETPQAKTPASVASVETWMTEEAENTLRRTGQPPKREALIADARRIFDVPVRRAKEAFEKLPAYLRRRRGHKSRP
ncbi:hypothetical protein GXW74_27610 [Roseomonas eburnea]|uniref:Uncharacterized protein n=2 Tax=Neoroseomonas eburnea TaxID=1346889 RepID=A0A9X9XKL9_9PROT|nr:hypothetical protein [Neoroseomonas eburnea]